MKLYFTVYKTINLINNKFYIGVHKTYNPNDSYLGSGKLILKAIKKYGKENFKKEIMFIFSSRKEMIKKEKEIVNENFIKNRNNYNRVLGGEDGLGRFLINEKKIIGKKISDSLKKKNEFGISPAKISYIKRNKTLLKKDKNFLKSIGIKSGETQKKNLTSFEANNVNFSIYIIYNQLKQIYCICFGDFKNKCKIFNLPNRALVTSIKNNGNPIYSNKKTLNKFKKNKFKGFSAVKIKLNKKDNIKPLKLSFIKLSIISFLKINKLDKFNNKLTSQFYEFLFNKINKNKKKSEFFLKKILLSKKQIREIIKSFRYTQKEF